MIFMNISANVTTQKRFNADQNKILFDIILGLRRMTALQTFKSNMTN